MKTAARRFSSAGRGNASRFRVCPPAPGGPLHHIHTAPAGKSSVPGKKPRLFSLIALSVRGTVLIKAQPRGGHFAAEPAVVLFSLFLNRFQIKISFRGCELLGVHKQILFRKVFLSKKRPDALSSPLSLCAAGAKGQRANVLQGENQLLRPRRFSSSRPHTVTQGTAVSVTHSMRGALSPVSGGPGSSLNFFAVS